MEKITKSKKTKNAFMRKRGGIALRILFSFVLIVAAVWVISKILYLPFFAVDEDKIVRNINKAEVFFFEKEPTNRNVAWDSELPKLIENDIEYARKNQYEEIEYNFLQYEISIYVESEEITIYVTEKYDYGVYEFIYGLENFSIYKNKDSEIIIYGYTSDCKWFSKYYLGKEECDSDTLTYNIDLPLDMEEYSIGTNNVDGYTLINIEDSFYFYKDGKKISSSEFPGKIRKVDIYNGLILTQENELYIMYTKLKDEKPTLVFMEIGTADEFSDYIVGYGYDFIKTKDGMYTPIITKDGEKYTLVPNDIRTFKAAGLQNADLDIVLNKPDYTVSIVKLEELFKRATFDYNTVTNSRWYAEICFEINGIEFFFNRYGINGYDDSINLPEETYQKLEKTVYSIDGFWEHVETIRKVYFDYYDHKGL